MILRNARLYNEDFDLIEADLELEGKTIKAVLPRGTKVEGAKEVDLTGKKILPGFIDIHIHGSNGADTMDADEAGMEKMSRYLATKGVTSFLPTTMTTPAEELVKAFALKPELSGAKMLGFNMEGPFLNVLVRGAHREDQVRKPSISEIRRYMELGKVKIVTIAPETEGALDFIEELGDEVVCSIGHTAADYETTKEAIHRGAKSLTHTFNAMTPIHHRAPGVIPAAVEAGIYAELIADGHHVHPAVVYSAYRMFGKDRLILISDAMRAAGLPDGEYDLGGQQMRVQDGNALSPDNKIAGSTTNLHNCLVNAVSFGIPEADVVRMLSLNPATLIGENETLGSISAGKHADLVIVNDDLSIDSVYIGGALYVED